MKLDQNEPRGFRGLPTFARVALPHTRLDSFKRVYFARTLGGEEQSNTHIHQ